jgi:hypothetical protein
VDRVWGRVSPERLMQWLWGERELAGRARVAGGVLSVLHVTCPEARIEPGKRLGFFSSFTTKNIIIDSPPTLLKRGENMSHVTRRKSRNTCRELAAVLAERGLPPRAEVFRPTASTHPHPLSTIHVSMHKACTAHASHAHACTWRTFPSECLSVHHCEPGVGTACSHK